MGLSTGNGLRQWMFQRFSNVVLIIFALVLTITLTNAPSYESLSELFAQVWFKAYLFFTLLIASLNSILAGWQIAGDYAHKVNLPSNVLTGIGVLITLIYFVVASMLIF